MGHHHHPAELSVHERTATNLDIPDSGLTRSELGRRNFLRAAGVIGVGVAATTLVDDAGVAHASTVTAPPGHRGRTRMWLAGDHHIHTQFSPDGLYTVEDQVKHGVAFGLDWMVITDHGGAAHARIGVDKVNPHIRSSRELHPDALIFQGLEWNIPAAEHGTVFVHPGNREVEVLKAFENGYDGSVTGTSGNSPENEALAVRGIQFLADAVSDKRVSDALMLANHPARQGIDSPHEVRAWRDAAPHIAVGWEGAPGHQAAGIPASALGPGAARGYYGNSPRADRSFPGYPLEAYRTWGGFDWFTSTVGGLWDSMLAEGKTWWISANSDSHTNYLDTAVRGPGSDFDRDGQYRDPVYSGRPNTGAGDFWPGFYSRTMVGTNQARYADVMQGLRNGNVWVDHGRLLEELDVQVAVRGQAVGLGGALTVRRGSRAELRVTATPAQRSNWAQFVPALAKIDVIKGRITGPVPDQDTFTTEHTHVVQTWEVSGSDPHTLTLDLGEVDETGFYVRLRGSDGKRSQAGWLGADVDPSGPAIDVVGDGDPWEDLWFYTNPIFILPQR